MAKVKSKKKTIEDALVPVAEHPYEVPDNWCWVEIGKITDVISGGTPSTSHREYYENGEIAWISPSDLSGYEEIYIRNGKKNITALGLEKSSARLLPKNTVCLSTRAPIGYVVIAESELCTNQGFKSFLPSEAYLPEFLYWYLKGNKDMLESQASGTTFLELSGRKASELSVPIPPLAEQQRIVEQIESLFAKLEEAKEKATEALEGSENRKSAMLFKAYSGDLTKKWRQENGVSIDNWKKVKLKDVCKINPPKIDTKELPDDLKVSFFPMASLSEITGSMVEYQTRPLKEVKKGFTNFLEGDVVFAKITPCMENGKSAIIPKLVNDIGYGTTEFFVIRCSADISNEYIYHLIRSKKFRDDAKAVMTGAVGQQRVPKDYLENYSLLLPSLDEQREIIRITGLAMDAEQKTVERCESVINSIDIMKKAILAKAFRGELGTNDPVEESSVELMKQILQ